MSTLREPRDVFPNPLCVYLAAPFDRRQDVLAIAERFFDLGVRVTSRWLVDPDKPEREAAEMNVADIIKAHGVMLLADLGKSTEGSMHVEWGVGIGLNKILWHIGPRANVFTAHPRVRRYATIDDWLIAMKIIAPPVV